MMQDHSEASRHREIAVVFQNLFISCLNPFHVCEDEGKLRVSMRRRRCRGYLFEAAVLRYCLEFSLSFNLCLSYVLVFILIEYYSAVELSSREMSCLVVEQRDLVSSEICHEITAASMRQRISLSVSSSHSWSSLNAILCTLPYVVIDSPFRYRTPISGVSYTKRSKQEYHEQPRSMRPWNHRPGTKEIEMKYTERIMFPVNAHSCDLLFQVSTFLFHRTSSRKEKKILLSNTFDGSTQEPFEY